MLRTSLLRLLALGLLARSLVGCDTFYGVQGTVRDCTDQRPLEGAAVRLSMLSDGELKHDETVSASDGSFTAVLNEPDSELPSTLDVLRFGYVPLTVTVTHPHQAQSLCLAPLGP